MKKITRNILVISGVTILFSFTTTKIDNQFELNEIQNTAEDMIEWINYDVENGKIYKEYAEMYIENLNEIIERVDKVKTINCENCDEID
jgi:hypothetical protein